MADVFHTFFGLCGLMLLNYFDGKTTDGITIKTSQQNNNSGDNKNTSSSTVSAIATPAIDIFEAIDPTYALPISVVKRLGLTAQVLQYSSNNSSNNSK